MCHTGYYATFTPDPAVSNSSASLRAPRRAVVGSTDQPCCLQFWYLLFGEDVAALYVQTDTGEVVWSESGPNARRWRLAQVDLPYNALVSTAVGTVGWLFKG